MELLKQLSEFFNIIEPWLVFFSLIVQIILFFMFLKVLFQRQQLTNDMINKGLRNINTWLDKQGNKTIPVKEKDALKDKK